MIQIVCVWGSLVTSDEPAMDDDAPSRREIPGWQNPAVGVLFGCVCFLLACAFMPDGAMKPSGYGIVLFFSAIGPLSLLFVWYGWPVMFVVFTVFYLVMTKTRGLARFALASVFSYAWLYAGMRIIAMNG